MVILQVLFGVISGVFGGLGMGGGTLLIPLLTIFLGVEQTMAQGINLLSFLVMAIVSILIHNRNGFIHMKGMGYLIAGGMFFSFFGAILAVNIPSKILKLLFGFFLCLLASFELCKVFKRAKK